MAGAKKTNYKRKNGYGNAKRNYRKRDPLKLATEQYHTETLKGHIVHQGTADGAGASKCIITVACNPAASAATQLTAENGTSFPAWAALAAKYDEFRVVYFSATVVMRSTASTVMSVVERDATAITDRANMCKNPAFKTHSLDGAKMEVHRGWKPSQSADFDWKKTDTPAAIAPPAYIKMLQDELPNQPKCETILTCKLQFRGLKN